MIRFKPCIQEGTQNTLEWIITNLSKFPHVIITISLSPSKLLKSGMI